MSDITDLLPEAYILGVRTEELDIKIECCQYADPIFLRWKNDLGGVDQWLFDKEVNESPEVQTINSYEKPLENIRYGDKLVVTEKRYNKVLIANTTFEKINAEGFRQMLRSECVEILDDNDDLTSFVKVDIELSNWNLKNTADYGKLTIKIKYPSNER